MSLFVKNMVEFVHVLRQSGVAVSTSEAMDAVSALQYVDIADREAVRTALGSCLAKSRKERDIFLLLFDKFFILPADRQQQTARKVSELEERKQSIEEAAAELKFRDQPLSLQDEFKEIYAALPHLEQQGILDFLDKTSTGKNVREDFKEITEAMVKGRLQHLKQKHADRIALTAGILSADASEAGILSGEVTEEIRRNADLLYKNIDEIRGEEIPRAVRLIREMVDALRRDMSKKYRRASGRSRLDVRRTLRAGISTGGVLFKLRYKSRSPRKTRLLLLSDVSASMLRFSGFVLEFMQQLNSSFSSVEGHIFSERIEPLELSRYGGVEDFEAQVRSSPVWGKGTDIAQALEAIISRQGKGIGSDTILIIVSDGKTIRTEEAAAALGTLSGMVKKIFWLNPLPVQKWLSVKNLDRFGKHCLMLDCSTLERLAAACAKL